MTTRARRLWHAGTALLAALAVLGACTNPTGENPVPVARVAISPANPSVEPGGTLQLTAAVSPGNATDKTVAWTSSDPAVATVSAAGLVTGKAAGTADITAASPDGPSDTVTVTVASTPAAKPLQGISLPASLELSKGASATLTPVFTPTDTTQTGLTWSSSDPTVATVSDGAVAALGGGTAVITAASTANAALRGATTVNVTAPLVGIQLSPNPLVIGEGDTGEFTVIYDPPDTTQKGVTWSSGNTAVATAHSSTGRIAAAALGTAVITATSTVVPGKTAGATVQVVVPVPIAGLSLSPATVNIAKGASATLSPVFTPTDTTQKGVVWSSSDPAVATVTGGVVQAKGGGTAVITAASTANNNISATVTVTVTVPLLGISLSPNPLALTGVGSAGELTVIYDPPDTTQKGVTWSSNAAGVAAVSDGTVTAVAGGTAVITAASTVAAGKNAAATVTVTIPLVRLGLNATTLPLTKGAAATLTPVFTPPDTTQKDVEWSSSNPSAATVSGGTVTAVGGGTATITARSRANNTISAAATVTVTVPLTGISLSPPSRRIGIGSTGALTALYEPPDATQTGVSWSSSDPTVATVSGGTVTGLAAGTATITARSTVSAGIAATATVDIFIPIPITGLSVSPTALNLNKGDPAATLTPIFTPTDTTDTDLIWSSSNTAVATVSGGKVTAVGGGTAVITAASTANNSIRAAATVTVTVPLTGISLSPASRSIGEGSTGAFTVIYDPPDTTQKGVSWSSSTTSVATVSGDADGGTVAAVAAGTATITAASTAVSAKTAAATVTVFVPIPLTALSLSPASLTINKGASDTLSPVFTPGNTTDRDLIWSSSDPTVATVTDGAVQAKGGGTAVITARSAVNTGISAAATVTVTVPLTGISLSPAALNLSGAGSTDSFTVNFTPPDTTQKSVTWSSSAASVATAHSSTGLITAVGGGTASITATSTAHSGIQASATVNVTIPLTGLGLNKTTLSLSKGGSDTLTPVFTPAATTQTGVTWSSSDPEVATVSGGTVTAVGGGTATITAASTANSGIQADCTVTVTVPLSGISLPATRSLGVGQTSSLPVEHSPPDATQTGVTWSSSNTSVATVDSSTGLITGVALGTATITATATANSGIHASCALTVADTKTEVAIVFEGFEDETITLDTRVSQGGQLIVTAPAGFYWYMWYVDGNFRLDGSVPTMTLGVGTLGRHYLTVIVEKTDGSHFSKTVHYTVGY